MLFASAVPPEYRQSVFRAEIDLVYRRFLLVSSSVGVLVLLIVLLAPRREHVITDVSQVPDRFARLILEEPKPPAPRVAENRAKAAEPAPTKTPEKAQATPPVRERRSPVPQAAPDQGEAGRVKARKEVTRSIAGATASAEKALEGLSSSLGKTTATTTGAKRRRRRAVAGGRGTSDLAAVENLGGRGTAEVGRSGLGGSLLAVESVTTVTGGGEDSGSGSGEAEATGSGSGAYRSNASLLAVVRRYAPGIEFCYDNQLKRSPGLRGKLVAAITVAASGEVTGVHLVTDSLGSAALSQCVLAQIQEWKFPAIPEGSTTFQTPFVFTPPQG
jgi:TonB family protein